MDCSKPFFAEQNKKYEQHFGEDWQEAIPRMLMAEDFKGGDDGIKRMIAAGQMKETVIENMPFCCVRKFKVGKSLGTEKSVEIQKARVG